MDRDRALPAQAYRHSFVPPAEPGAPESEDGGWLLSFADLTTLLLTLFVLLLAYTQLRPPMHAGPMQTTADVRRPARPAHGKATVRPVPHIPPLVTVSLRDGGTGSPANDAPPRRPGVTRSVPKRAASAATAARNPVTAAVRPVAHRSIPAPTPASPAAARASPAAPAGRVNLSRDARAPQARATPAPTPTSAAGARAAAVPIPPLVPARTAAPLALWLEPAATPTIPFATETGAVPTGVHPAAPVVGGAAHSARAKAPPQPAFTIPEDIRDQVEITRSAGAVNLIIRDDVLYAPGAAGLTRSGRTLLDRIARLLGSDRYAIRVEGFTDSTPIHTARFPSNWELSTARATSVTRYLISRGITARRLSAVGYGDTRPRASNATPQGRARNRRVSLVVQVKGTAPRAGTRTPHARKEMAHPAEPGGPGPAVPEAGPQAGA